MNHEMIEQGVRLILEGIGEDINREGLLETPNRIARMYEEIVGGMHEDAAVPSGKALSGGTVMIWFWRKTLPSIRCASIICCRFLERLMWLIYQMALWWD